MKILNKSIEDLEIQDIERLISNQVPESITLDYKKELKLSTSSDKKEFLADISSFNNTNGGVIIYGLQEEKDQYNKNKGIPESITPLAGINEDQTKQQIEQLVADGLSPKLTSLKFEFISHGNGVVIVIGIPNNFGLPRMIVHSGSNKFYKRRNTGRYLLDVYELSDEFLKSGNMKERFDAKHESRVSKVRAINLMRNVSKERFALISIFPVDSMNLRLDLKDRKITELIKEKLRPIGASLWSDTYNLEGFFVFSEGYYSDEEGRKIYSYVQVFRDGVIEFYTSRLHFYNTRPTGSKWVFLGHGFEKTIDEIIHGAFSFYSAIDIENTFYVKVSVVGLEGTKIVNDNDSFFRGGLIDRRSVTLPGYLIDLDNYEEVILDIKDTMWQCGGQAKSISRELKERINR